MILVVALFAAACSGGDGSDAGADDAGFDANDGLIHCDPRLVTCESLPPMCGVGFVPGVRGDCWDVCVQAVLCNSIECEDAMPECPDGWGCVLGECRPPR